MKKIIIAVIWAILTQISVVHAANWSSGNPFVEMMRSMLNMFELMQLYQDYSAYSNLSTVPHQFSPGQFNYAPFAQLDNNRFPGTPPRSAPFSTRSIEGLWASDANTLLLIRKNYAQIYWSRTQYRNYYLKTSVNQLIFVDAESGNRQTFDMVTQADQMVLRDKNGEQLLFRRLSTEHFQPYSYN